jgi:hypothetical protein
VSVALTEGAAVTAGAADSADPAVVITAATDAAMRLACMSVPSLRESTAANEDRGDFAKVGPTSTGVDGANRSQPRAFTAAPACAIVQTEATTKRGTMTYLISVKRVATGVALTALLVTGGAVPAVAVSPADTVSDCTMAKDQAMDSAKAAFKSAKKKAWSTYAASEPPKVAAAKARREALKTARITRKADFIKARKAFTACVATATSATPGTTPETSPLAA